MPSAICTLFEGHYHYGLAVLTNSFYRNGFRGSVYAGYKGDLPNWASAAYNNPALNWQGAKTLDAAEGLQVHFMPLDTENHFSNYKPDFMLRLWDGPAADAKRMYYFDPDIVIVCPWLLFEEWVTCGVAVSEDVNSPLSKQHPRRVAWRRYFGEKGINLNFKNSIYVNSGFIGVEKKDKNFLEMWKKIQDTLAPLIGGLGQSIFRKDHLESLEQIGGPFMPFVKTDQDSLNAAIEACDTEISFIGKEGMGFEMGFFLMHHALGSHKPWQWKPFMQSLDGRPPREVDVEFWKVADAPIKSIPKHIISIRNFSIKVTRGIGRFYKRN